jgi:alanine racemase
MEELTWVEISKEALTSNIKQFRRVVGEKTIICPCVKANAYGHDLVLASKTFLEAGADWLAVNSIYEARTLRESGIDSPIYVLGYIPLNSLEEAVNLNLRMVVYNIETVDRLGLLSEKLGKTVKIHLKIETGNNRQGILKDDLVEFAEHVKTFPNIEIEGISTHFANIEDTTDHSYAQKQLDLFAKDLELLKAAGIEIPIRHCANSAATLLFKKTHFEMVRPGIACYGMWPSNETYVSYLKDVSDGFKLTPAFTWKTKIAQIKTIPAGEYIGYGCTYKTTHETRLAILPIGYYDGYDRGVLGAHVLINGKRAPLRGRVCMNIIIVEISDIPEANIEDEVVLIGRFGSEEISVEQFASWASTINYEIPTRVNERIRRILV